MEDSKDPFAGLFPAYQPMENAFPFLKKQRQEQATLQTTLQATLQATLDKQGESKMKNTDDEMLFKSVKKRQALNELKAATALRDKFALYAMHAMLTFGDTQGRNPQHISSVSYSIADAMMEERKEKEE